MPTFRPRRGRRPPTDPASFASRGRWFQTLVDAACTHYRAAGRAYICPVPVPVRFDRGGKEAFFERKSTTDYLGFLPLGGRVINGPTGLAFDAKSSRTGPWSSGIPDHQLEVLRFVHALGHLSGILLGYYLRGWVRPRTVWVPWPAAQQLAVGSWSLATCLTLPSVREVAFVGYPDFLPAILKGDQG